MSDGEPQRAVRTLEHARPAAERLRRIWQLVEDIAGTPGKTRRQLARQYNLSERQLQADLNVIREPMGLPLVRRQGYRFAGDDADAGSVFSLAEAQLLVMVLRRAARDPGLPSERLQGLMRKLPLLFPLHLRPLVGKTLEAEGAAASRQHEVFATLADALLRKSYVQLHYPAGCLETPLAEPIVQPEVLFPYHNSWHLIGPCRQRGRVMVFDLGAVVAVTQASGL